MSVPARTTNKQVEQLLGDNWDECTSVAPYVRAASALVDQIVLCAARRKKVLPDEDLAIIETWIAAYRYTLTDPLFTSRSTAGASGSFANGDSTLMGIQNRYKRGAIESDWSGCTNAVLNRLVAGFSSLGTPTACEPDGVGTCTC